MVSVCEVTFVPTGTKSAIIWSVMPASVRSPAAVTSIPTRGRRVVHQVAAFHQAERAGRRLDHFVSRGHQDTEPILGTGVDLAPAGAAPHAAAVAAFVPPLVGAASLSAVANGMPLIRVHSIGGPGSYCAGVGVRHLRLPRTVEIVVVDVQRRIGG